MEDNRGPKRKLSGTESYDQKLEQRATKHEFLRDRNNITTCRSHGHKLEAEWKTDMQRKRQVEFQRRRHIVLEAPLGDDPSNQENKVKMRTNRHKGGLLNRHSFISADELGINWPNVNKPRKTTLVSSPTMHGACELTTSEQQNLPSGITGSVLPMSNVTLRCQTGPRNEVQQRQVGKTNRHLNHVNASSQTGSGYVTVKEADVLQLANYLREALWREQTVKQKLALLKNTAATLLLSHDNVWKNCSKVDQMKTRIDSLETQLKTSSQKLSRDEAKRLVLQAEQQRQESEEKAIISLQRIMNLKTHAEENVAKLEVALKTTHIESAMWKQRYEEEKNYCSQLRTLLELHQQPEAELCLKVSLLEENRLVTMKKHHTIETYPDNCIPAPEDMAMPVSVSDCYNNGSNVLKY